MAVLSEVSRTFDENGIYVASRRYDIEALSDIHIEIDNYVGQNYKFFIYNDDILKLSILELVVAIRSYKKLSKEVIEKEVAGEDYPAYISTKVDGLDFIYLEQLYVQPPLYGGIFFLSFSVPIRNSYFKLT